MRQDAFSRYHPVVNFLFFLCAIAFGVVIQHPAYMLAGCVGAAMYYILLKGSKGFRGLLGMLPVALILTCINPLFNTQGVHVLFTVFGRPYTLEALFYGMIIAGMFVVMMLWFGCYNDVLTSDKFTSLFGNLIPGLSLLLIMVLRLIPNFIRKTKQIIGARNCIGKGANAQSTKKEKINDGMTVLSALTDWALEGSVVTADSMRARGYGTARRSSFQIYTMTVADWVLLAMIVGLSACVIVAGGTSATFTPEFEISPISWGFFAYCVLLLIPIALQIKEAITWHILRSKI